MKQLIERVLAVGYEGIQKVRIEAMNQMRDIIRKKSEGIEFNEVEIKKDKKEFEKKYSDKDLLKQLELLVEQEKIIPEESEYLFNCFEIIKQTKKIESEYKKSMMSLIRTDPIYFEFLEKIRGIGIVLSIKLIKEFGSCSQYDTVSKLWAHTGNHVVNGKAPERRKGQIINYNPKLRTLTWLVSDCLMKSNKGYYRENYITEKQKQLNREYKIGELKAKYGEPYEENEVHLRKGHAHNRALRKIRKIFLDHYWHCSRELNGLPAKKNYVEGVLQHTNITTWKDAIRREEEVKNN